MAAKGRFPPGRSGNSKTQFSAGNRHRWPEGQSGNPSGKPKTRLQFEQAFTTALLEQGSAEEAAALLWAPARKGEPWAVQAILQRLAPVAEKIHHSNDEINYESPLDLSRFSKEQFNQFDTLCDVAAVPAPAPGGASDPEP